MPRTGGVHKGTAPMGLGVRGAASTCGCARGRWCTWGRVCKGQHVWMCKVGWGGCAAGEWVLLGARAPRPLGVPVNLCLRRLWFTFDPVLYICKQL